MSTAVRKWNTRAATVLCAALLLLVLTGCTAAGNAAPVLKLGVIAPFEGRGRALGYSVLPSIKAVVAEANASGTLGPYRVLVVAFNDNLDPVTARQQAAAQALDEDVVGVVGPFSADTTAAARPVLAAAMVPVAPVTAARLTGDDFHDEQSQAKEAARSLLKALAAQIQTTGRPVRPAPSVR